MLCKEVQNYLATAKGLPFFYVVGDEGYSLVLEEFKQMGITVVRLSDFCYKDDKFPSIDDLVDYFRTSDVDYRDNKFVVVGIGEYLAIRGQEIADKELRRLKNTTLGNARAILLLRGIDSEAVNIFKDDNKIYEQQRAYISTNTSVDISITVLPKESGLVENAGIRFLLKAMEDGLSGNISVSTALILDNAKFRLVKISNSYSAVKYILRDFELDIESGTDEMWQHLLMDLNKCEKSIAKVFDKNGIDERIFDDFHSVVSGLEYKNWLVFIYLKIFKNNILNNYLKLVVSETDDFLDFKTNLIVKIIELSHVDHDFMLLYEDRKKLLRSFPEEDIAIFVKANEVDNEESIYRLTDNTMIEKKTIIKWIVKNGIIDEISYIYPALNYYLKRYSFEGVVYKDELADYFDDYKKQKVTNHIDEAFLKRVSAYATGLLYAKLPTRDNAVKAISDKQNTYLYWIDALGIEYLSYFTYLAKKKGLSMQVDIVRSDLPTITSTNKQFFEQWSGGKKYKEEQLDNIKHKDKGGYFFTTDEDPIYIPAELEVIEKAMNTAAMELGMHNCKAFVIASDHGASRLAVIKKQELPYDTDTKGEHSGRCCKYFEGCDVPYKVEDNGFIMLSDYGRFRGSRAANVEVHGGASLEEIVVPVITLTLKKQTGIQITVIHPEDIVANRHTGTSLVIYISEVQYMDKISLVIGENHIPGTTEDGIHYTFILKDIKRSRIEPYNADVFDGMDLIGSVSFKVKGKTATIKDDFNFDEDF